MLNDQIKAAYASLGALISQLPNDVQPTPTPVPTPGPTPQPAPTPVPPATGAIPVNPSLPRLPMTSPDWSTDQRYAYFLGLPMEGPDKWKQDWAKTAMDKEVRLSGVDVAGWMAKMDQYNGGNNAAWVNGNSTAKSKFDLTTGIATVFRVVNGQWVPGPVYPASGIPPR